MSRNNYNIISFLILPMIILIIGFILVLISHFSIWKETVNYDLVTDKSLRTQLWNVIEISDVETAYIVYGLNDWSLDDDDYLIVIQGRSIEDIKRKVESCYPGAYRYSYIKDVDDYRVIGMTVFPEVKDYIEEESTANYSNMSDDDKEVYISTITEKLEEARVYDISDYIGYEEEYNSGKGLAEAIAFIAILFTCGVALVLELIAAIIIKITLGNKLR